MLRGNRGEHLKTGLTLLAVVLALAFGVWVIASGLARDAEYERQADDHSREYAAYTQHQIGQHCVTLAPPDKIQCVAKARHEYRQDRREERDLVAQRKSANWAYVMGAAAVLGMVLSAIGVALVYTTFHETRRGADSSAEAARVAQANLKAFRDIEDVNIRVTEAGASFVRTHRKDFGAFLAGIGTRKTGRADPVGVTLAIHAEDKINWEAVDPEQPTALAGIHQIDVEEFHDRPFWLYGALQYHSVLVDTPRRSYFAFKMIPIPEGERRFNKKKDHVSYQTHRVAERLEPPDRPADT